MSPLKKVNKIRNATTKQGPKGTQNNYYQVHTIIVPSSRDQSLSLWCRIILLGMGSITN